MKCRTSPQIDPTQVDGQVHGKLGGGVEATIGESSSVRLGVLALLISDGDWFLNQSWSKVLSTPRKLTSAKTAIWWPSGCMGPPGLVWFQDMLFLIIFFPNRFNIIKIIQISNLRKRRKGGLWVPGHISLSLFLNPNSHFHAFCHLWYWHGSSCWGHWLVTPWRSYCCSF